MKPNSDPHAPQPPIPAPSQPALWRKIGAGSLSISLVIHVALLAIGVIWVFQVIPVPEKDVNFLPTSGGGSSVTHSKPQPKPIMPTDLPRTVAIGAGGLTMPEPETTGQLASLGGLSSGSLGKGLSSGAGSGISGNAGAGSGLIPGVLDGAGSKNPFGMAETTAGGLAGCFYDLKQTSDRQPTHMDRNGMGPVLREFLARDLKERAFEKYFKAPRQLYQTKFMIPAMNADAAPAAFECEKEVEPSRWAVVYRGAVQAPKSGKFRFVGAADDVLVIRFNNRPVFDYGYTLLGASIGTGGAERYAELNGSTRNPELEKNIRRNTPMRLPLTYYRYEALTQFNNGIGGLVAGAEFEVEQGRSYPIEILISEIPGGSFGVYLLIEEIGAKYEKAPGGAPILPIFRLDGSLPDTSGKSQFPP
ncbi:hypothetical protein HQ447_14110, partial [bacterium]|nr:hypothetical protein [bacterium]